MGGGAAAGIAKVEHDHKSISKAFTKSGEFLSSIFGSSSSKSSASKNGVLFLDKWFQVLYTVFSSIPGQVSSVYSTVNPFISAAFHWLKDQDFRSLPKAAKDSGLSWKDIQDVFNELWEKQLEVKKIVTKLIEQKELLKKMHGTVSKNKDEYFKAIHWISEKAGNYKQLLKYFLQESTLLTEQLTKLEEKWDTISSKLEDTVKKLNKKKSDIEEITKDIEWSNLTKEGGAWDHIKKNLGDYLVELLEKSNEIDTWISNLKSSKDKLKLLIKNSGDSIAGWLEKKEELSTALDLQSSGGLKLSDIFSNLTNISEDSFSKLEQIQQKMTSSPQTAKLLIKSAGKGWTGFVKVINNWSKYEALMNNIASKSSKR